MLQVSASSPHIDAASEPMCAAQPHSCQRHAVSMSQINGCLCSLCLASLFVHLRQVFFLLRHAWNIYSTHMRHVCSMRNGSLATYMQQLCSIYLASLLHEGNNSTANTCHIHRMERKEHKSSNVFAVIRSQQWSQATGLDALRESFPFEESSHSKFEIIKICLVCGMN